MDPRQYITCVAFQATLWTTLSATRWCESNGLRSRSCTTLGHWYLFPQNDVPGPKVWVLPDGGVGQLLQVPSGAERGIAGTVSPWWPE